MKRVERGQSFVEMAVGMVVLVMLLGGLFDVGRSFIILTAVENASGEGALYGATHPECLTHDHAATICQGNASVVGRVLEEGKPVIALNIGQVSYTIEGDGAVAKGNIVRVDVNYQYTPVTPVGFLLWGATASVSASARQEILSSPPPGYQYSVGG